MTSGAWTSPASTQKSARHGDTTPPKVRTIDAFDITSTSAKVTWTLNEHATGLVRYGQTNRYGQQTAKETSFDYLTHVQLITGLEPGEAYHFEVVSTDRAGNTVRSLRTRPSAR